LISADNSKAGKKQVFKIADLPASTVPFCLHQRPILSIAYKDNLRSTSELQCHENFANGVSRNLLDYHTADKDAKLVTDELAASRLALAERETRLLANPFPHKNQTPKVGVAADSDTSGDVAIDPALQAIHALLGMNTGNRYLTKADKAALYPHFVALYPKKTESRYERFAYAVFAMTCTTTERAWTFAEDIVRAKSEGMWNPDHPAFDSLQIPYLANYLQLDSKSRSKYNRRLRNWSSLCRKNKRTEFSSFMVKDLGDNDDAERTRRAANAKLLAEIESLSSVSPSL
jgi:hypothetical protein